MDNERATTIQIGAGNPGGSNDYELILTTKATKTDISYCLNIK